MCIAANYPDVQILQDEFYIPDHRHVGYHNVHDPGDLCCTCCNISKKWIILDILKSLLEFIPTHLGKSIKDEIDEFYEENSEELKFIPRSLKNTMIVMMLIT